MFVSFESVFLLIMKIIKHIHILLFLNYVFHIYEIIVQLSFKLCLDYEFTEIGSLENV